MTKMPDWSRHVVLVHGKKQSGKDTFADIARNLFDIKSLHFATPLKEDILKRFPVTRDALFGTGEQKEAIIPELGISGRKLMQVYGTDMMASLWDPVWARACVREVQAVEERARQLKSAGWMRVIPDMRRKVEIAEFAPYNPIMLKVVRPGQDTSDQHSSETELDDVEFKNVLVNDGTLEEFRAKAHRWLWQWQHGQAMGG